MNPHLTDYLAAIGLDWWAEILAVESKKALSIQNNRDLARWSTAIEDLPSLVPDWIEFNANAVTLHGSATDLQNSQLHEQLMEFHPWRKGPFQVYDLFIDTEWKSYLKWNRLVGHLDLDGKTVLDVGCGNGYYGYRMLGAGAKFVLGLDPFLLYVMQFHAIEKLLGCYPNFVLPLGDRFLRQPLNAFDVVFSMGVLYHRQSPLDHLKDLKNALRNGGELVLETLVAEDGHDLLFPTDRYAKMRNVWFIPSTKMLHIWLQRIGFRDIRLLDITPTSSDEQRTTDWMRFESFDDFVDPTDRSITIEGYPSPIRAVFRATR